MYTDFEVRICTTRVHKWSNIEAIALKVGQDVGEISSHNGKFIMNGKEVKDFRNEALTVIKSNLKRNIFLYICMIHGDKRLEIKINILSQMIYITLSGEYPQNTEGLLGSPHHPGPLSRNREAMSSANINDFAETWQVRDNDLQLFNMKQEPQFPSKCWYEVKKLTVSH